MFARTRLNVTLYVNCLAALFSFQKFPAVYSVLCIPAQIIVITTAEVTASFFLQDNPQAIFCMVFNEDIFLLSQGYIFQLQNIIFMLAIQKKDSMENFHKK